MALIVNIGGTDYGPSGEDRVTQIDITQAGSDQIGSGSVTLVYPETETYSILNTNEVEIYDDDDLGNAAYLGGVVSLRKQTQEKGTSPSLLVDKISVQDLNLAADVVVRRAAAVYRLNIAAGTMAAQIAQLVPLMQENGYGSVKRPINAVDYVSNLTGVTVLPAFTIQGESLRDALNKVMAGARSVDPTINPAWSIQYLPDGAGGFEDAIWTFDKAAPVAPSFVIATDANIGLGEYPIYSLDRDTNSTKLTQAQQSIWGEGEGFVATFTNEDSRDAYPNPWQNDDGPDGSGFWWMKPIRDKDSANETEALAKLSRRVKPKQFPIDTFSVTVDNIRIRPGQTATLRIPERGLTGDYTCVGVSITFPKKNNPSYLRVRIILGSRKRSLFDKGEDGEATPPIERGPQIPDTPVITGITSVQDGVTFTATVTFTHDGMVGGGRCYYKPTLGDVVRRVDIEPQDSPATVEVPGLERDIEYQFWVVVYDAFGTPSARSNVETHTPTLAFLDPPSVSVVRSGLDRSGYYLIVQVDHATENFTYGGYVLAHPVNRGFDTLVPIPLGTITDEGRPRAALPINVRIPGLAVKTRYELTAIIENEVGQESTPTDPPTEYVVNPVPDQPTGGMIGWDAIPPDEIGTAGGVVSGWLQTDPDPTVEVVIDRTDEFTFGGRAALVFEVAPGVPGEFDFSDEDMSGLMVLI